MMGLAHQPTQPTPGTHGFRWNVAQRVRAAIFPRVASVTALTKGALAQWNGYSAQ